MSEAMQALVVQGGALWLDAALGLPAASVAPVLLPDLSDAMPPMMIIAMRRPAMPKIAAEALWRRNQGLRGPWPGGGTLPYCGLG